MKDLYRMIFSFFSHPSIQGLSDLSKLSAGNEENEQQKEDPSVMPAVFSSSTWLVSMDSQPSRLSDLSTGIRALWRHPMEVSR